MNSADILAACCLIAFAALIFFAYPEDKPKDWVETACNGNWGTYKIVYSLNGQITAICQDGSRHFLSPDERIRFYEQYEREYFK